MKTSKYKYKFYAYENILKFEPSYGKVIDCILDIHHEFSFDDFEHFIKQYAGTKAYPSNLIYGYLPKINQYWLLTDGNFKIASPQLLDFGYKTDFKNISSSYIYSKIEKCSKAQIMDEFPELVTGINNNKISQGQTEIINLSNIFSSYYNDVPYMTNAAKKILIDKFRIFSCISGLNYEQLMKYVYIYDNNRNTIHIPTCLHELERNFKKENIANSLTK